MTAIDRTAYPRPGTRLNREELDERYALTDADLDFIQVTARSEQGRLLLAVLLKTRRDLSCFPAPDAVDAGIVVRVSAQLGIAAVPARSDGTYRTKSLYRYQTAIRGHLSATPYGNSAERLVRDTMLEAAKTLSDSTDFINPVVEALQAAATDLPAFSTLDRLVNRPGVSKSARPERPQDGHQRPTTAPSS